MSYLIPIFKALEEAEVRYVVVGGVATVLHGHSRMTADVDIVLDLSPKAARKAIEVLSKLGLTPSIPEPLGGFADPSVRQRWIERGMQVFSLYSESNPMLRVDLFVEHPIDFDVLFDRSTKKSLGPTSVRVASIPDLIKLKEIADRPQDRLDIQELQKILEKTAHEA